jgi:hypothetical protein
VTSRRRTLQSLEAIAPGSLARRRANYRAAIERTNVTGLASLRDYQALFAPLLRESREWLCAQVPVVAAIDRVCGPVSGVPTVAMYPPGEPLPEPLRRDLEQLEEVATATGTQILQARNSDDSLAAVSSVSGRRECALAYLVVGDVEGNPIRQLIRERHGTTWQHSAMVLELAASRGFSRSEYESLQTVLAPHLPAADHPHVLARKHARQAAAATGKKKTAGQPWISFADSADLIGRPQAPNPRSDQVRSGQEKNPSAAAEQDHLSGVGLSCWANE